MHVAGIAFFLYTTAMTPQLQAIRLQNISQPTIVEPPGISDFVGVPALVSPDHAPPHPLTPRTMPVSPAAGLARAVGELARGLLRDHGH